MSVGLIHDNINMDNIKSMEQDMKQQPNLKMNDEQNVNKDMYVQCSSLTMVQIHKLNQFIDRFYY